MTSDAWMKESAKVQHRHLREAQVESSCGWVGSSGESFSNDPDIEEHKTMKATSCYIGRIRQRRVILDGYDNVVLFVQVE